jgi:hypothetical protein
MHCIKVLLIASALIGGVAHANDRVRVGKSQGTAWTFFPLDAGVAQGFFAKQGIDIESADLAGDARLQQAFAADSIALGFGSGPKLAFAAKGSPVIAVTAFAGCKSLWKLWTFVPVATGQGRADGARFAVPPARAQSSFLECLQFNLQFNDIIAIRMTSSYGRTNWPRREQRACLTTFILNLDETGGVRAA